MVWKCCDEHSTFSCLWFAFWPYSMLWLFVSFYSEYFLPWIIWVSVFLHSLLSCFSATVIFSLYICISWLWCYLLTYCMVQSRSWEANWFAASQEIPHILWNPKVHYRTDKRPPPVPILGQPNPFHILTSHLLEIHPNIIHPSMPRSPQWSLSLRFPHQDPIHSPLLTHTRHMPSPSHSSRFYHPHNIGWGVQTI